MKKLNVLAFALACGAANANFGQNNIVVTLIGDGTLTTTNRAYPIKVREYTTAGVQVGSDILLPTSASGAQRAITGQDSATEASEHMITRSKDGRYLFVSGYNCPAGTTNPGTTQDRTIARIAADGTVDTSTGIPLSEFPLGCDSVRTVWTDTGSLLYLASGSGGIVTIPFGATLGSTQVVQSTDITASVSSARVLTEYNGDLYYSSSDDFPNGGGTFLSNTIYKISGYPTTQVQAQALFGLNPSPRTVYRTADDTVYVACTTSAASLTKWKFNGTAWTNVYSAGASLGSLSGMAIVNGKFYAGNQAGTKVYEIVDTGTGFTWNKIIDITTSDANYNLKGVSITPVSETQFSGTVELRDFASPAGQVITFDIYSGGNLAETKTATLDGAGRFSLLTSVQGPYQLRAKGVHWLAQLKSVAGNNADFSLTNGDIDGDNSVTVFDYGVLSDYFDKSSSDGDWSTVGANGFAPKDADLDGDEAVTVFDYGIVSDNFDKSGD